LWQQYPLDLPENYLIPSDTYSNNNNNNYGSAAQRQLQYLDQETPGFMKCAVGVRKNSSSLEYVLLEETIRIARDPETQLPIGIRQGAQEGAIYTPSSDSDWFFRIDTFGDQWDLRFLGVCKSTHQQRNLYLKNL